MTAWVFTFGVGHVHPVTRKRLEQNFVVITVEDALVARAEMVRRFGQRWCGQYRTREEAGVDEFFLIELEGQFALGLLAGVRQ